MSIASFVRPRYSKRLAKICLIALIAQLIPTTPAIATTRYEVGISTGATLLRMTDKNLNKRLTDIEHLGASWIRVDFNWPAIQPDSPRVYHWQMYDRVVRAAGAHRLKVLAVIDYTPRWAQEPRCARLVGSRAAAIKCNPKNNDTFARFARAAAIRYKHSSIRAWEIWNEPNLSSYWKTAQASSTAVHADAKAYAGLANAAALQIRRNDPDAIIVTGGLAPLFEPVYPKGLRQSDYLKQVLPLLKRNLFDGIGIHPYSWPVQPGKVAVYNAFYTVDQGSSKYNLKTIMNTAGWGSKQIWGTEFGATTKGTISRAIPARNIRVDHISEDSQAQTISQGVDKWYDKANVGPLFVHSDSDQWLPTRKNEGGFGLRRVDGTKKPAYGALQKAVVHLDAQQ